MFGLHRSPGSKGTLPSYQKASPILGFVPRMEKMGIFKTGFILYVRDGKWVVPSDEHSISFFTFILWQSGAGIYNNKQRQKCKGGLMSAMHMTTSIPTYSP